MSALRKIVSYLLPFQTLQIYLDYLDFASSIVIYGNRSTRNLVRILQLIGCYFILLQLFLWQAPLENMTRIWLVDMEYILVNVKSFNPCICALGLMAIYFVQVLFLDVKQRFLIFLNGVVNARRVSNSFLKGIDIEFRRLDSVDLFQVVSLIVLNLFKQFILIAGKLSMSGEMVSPK